MTLLCEAVGVTPDDEMAIKDIIIETYKMEETETTEQLIDAVERWCVDNRPGDEAVLRYAWYLTGYYIGGLRAMQLATLIHEITNRSPSSSDNTPLYG